MKHDDECPTYYDGCHCSLDTLKSNIDRADRAEHALRRIASIAEQERKRVGSGWWEQVWEIANDKSFGEGVD